MAKKTIIPIGKKIKKARLEKKMSLDLIANETGMTKDQLKKIEASEKIPSVGTILQISRVLSIDSGFLLKEQEDNAEERQKAYTKRTENYAYTPLTTGALNKHLKAFKIVIEAEQPHEGVGFRHEGEEFIYVLNGAIEVKVGENTNVLKKGDSLHFNSAIKHDLINTGKTNAELIVVVYAP